MSCSIPGSTPECTVHVQTCTSTIIYPDKINECICIYMYLSYSNTICYIEALLVTLACKIPYCTH